MTQRIFDIENKKDYADLWDILPIEIKTIYKDSNGFPVYYINTTEIDGVIPSPVGLFKINWHDKTEITRPIQEATEDDIGKLCYFWGNDENDYAYGILGYLGTENGEKYYNIDNIDEGLYFEHCRRLTKQEIEELC